MVSGSTSQPVNLTLANSSHKFSTSRMLPKHYMVNAQGQRSVWDKELRLSIKDRKFGRLASISDLKGNCQVFVQGNFSDEEGKSSFRLIKFDFAGLRFGIPETHVLLLQNVKINPRISAKGHARMQEETVKHAPHWHNML